MKKICALAISLVLMSTLTSCSIRFEVRNRSKNNNTNYELTDINNRISFDNEESLNIDVKFGEVKILSYDGNEVIVTGDTNRGLDIINLEKGNGSIIIKDTSSDDILNDLFNNNGKLDLEIKIPNTFNGDIYLSYGAGSVKLNNISCKKINIEGGAGELDIEDILFDKLYISAGVGEIDIDLPRKSGEIDIDGGVGEVKVSLAEVGGDFTFDGGIGDAKIKLPENAPVYFNTESGIGSSNVNATTSGENTYKFDLTIGVGEIKVYN